MSQKLSNYNLSTENQLVRPLPLTAYITTNQSHINVIYHGSNHQDSIPLKSFNQWLESTGRLRYPLEHVDNDTGITTYYSGELTLDEFYEIHNGHNLAELAHEYINK